MCTQFDLDYLVKDLSGNPEIMTLLERGLSFMKLEKFEKAFEIFDELIDKYPGSPCGWFAKARLISHDFDFCSLLTEDTRHIVAEISDCLETAKKVVEEERRSEYELLVATYSDKIKRYLVENYIMGLNAAMDALINVAIAAESNSPSEYRAEEYALTVISENIYHAMYIDPTDSIYDIPEEIIEEIGSEYCALRFAHMHKRLFEMFLEPYSTALTKREFAQNRRDARAQVRINWNIKQGWGSQLDSNDIAMLDRECPVYEMYTYYNKDTETAKYSFEKLIREYAPFDDDNEKTFCLEEAMKIYEKFYKLLDYPFGNLDGIYFPEEIRDYAKRLTREEAERERERKEQEKIIEAEMLERQIQRDEERAQKNKRNIKILLALAAVAAVILVIFFLK